MIHKIDVTSIPLLVVLNAALVTALPIIQFMIALIRPWRSSFYARNAKKNTITLRVDAFITKLMLAQIVGRIHLVSANGESLSLESDAISKTVNALKPVKLLR